MFQCADRIAILPITRFLEAGAAEDRYLGGGRGHIFICSCYAQLISFEIEIKILKSIVFTVCEQEYMNMCPPLPNYRSSAFLCLEGCHPPSPPTLSRRPCLSHERLYRGQAEKLHDHGGNGT